MINGEAGASYWDHIKTNSDLFINGFSPYDDDDDFTTPYNGKKI